MSVLTQATHRAHEFLWGGDLAEFSPLRRRMVLMLRMLHAVGRDLAEGQLTLLAMSLVYTTLLALVPLIALSFSVLKGFGVHNQARPFLLAFFEPFGEAGVHITEQIIGFVDNTRVGVLGALGLGFLVYTVISLLQKTEMAFNFVWRVKHARRLAQRFSHYLSVLVIGPVLIFSAIGVTAAFFGGGMAQSLMQIDMLGKVVGFAATLLPFVLVIAAFSFVYFLMPNTRVRPGAALMGGVVAGILWQTLSWVFATFIVTSDNYTAIYAGFAIVIFFMIWLYLNWFILLIGASISFYHQYPAYLASPQRELELSNRVKEKIALLAMTFIGRNFYDDAPSLTLESLAARMHLSPMPVAGVMRAIERAGYITETADDPPRYLPARDFEGITVKELLDAVRTAEEEGGPDAESLPRVKSVDSVFSRLDAALDASLQERNLRELAQAGAMTEGGKLLLPGKKMDIDQ